MVVILRHRLFQTPRYLNTGLARTWHDTIQKVLKPLLPTYNLGTAIGDKKPPGSKGKTACFAN